MLDPEAFDDRVFGFHAQQAVEKALKAWLHLVTGEHPFTHDLSLLLHLLETRGVDVSPWWEFLDLSGYAVRFRYEMFPEGEELLDRELLAVSVRSLVRRVRGMVFPATA
jgi:HEPN domain-containing protein